MCVLWLYTGAVQKDLRRGGYFSDAEPERALRAFSNDRPALWGNPVVRETGGLKDSIQDSGDGKGNGFTFCNYDSGDMLYAVRAGPERL